MFKPQLLIFSLLTLILFGCSSKENNLNSITNPTKTTSTDQTQNNQPVSYRWETEILATNLRIPWDVAVLPNSEILFTERGGNLKKIHKDESISDIAKISQSLEIGEGGLTGIALDPEFAKNNNIYLYYTYSEKNRYFNRISQFKYQNNSISDEKFIINNLPGGTNHNSGRLRFGPDNKLYILTGDAGQSQLAQNPESLAGKILRVNADGSTPSDNPNPNSLIFSSGHRNPQGLDWHPISKQLLVAEHGQEAHDEVNLIEPGKNYGWPNEQECFSDNPKFTNPLFCSEKNRYAPSGAAFIGNKLSGLENAFFVANLRGEKLIKFEFVNNQLINEEVILENIGRVRAVSSYNNESLLITTSNLDGRGNIQSGDDKIIKVTPVKN